MPLIPEFALTPRDDDEGLFSRNIDGQLVRLDAPTEADYERVVSLEINGRPVQVPLAEPMKDALGNIVQDVNGCTSPRYTTILDAIVKLHREGVDGEDEVSIPTLCHQPHMTPVAVCRVCSVQVWGKRGGKRTPERKLLPACQHQVKEGMEVFTKDAPGPDGERVSRAVRILTELLIADHLNSESVMAHAGDASWFNELKEMADRCGLSHSRFSISEFAREPSAVPIAQPPSARRALDSSSPVFLVDHSNCILCDRCIRACNEVVENRVIGRTGKGRTAGIGFDLNDPMFASTCVQCGECMVSCPTSAITFKPLVEVGPVGRRVEMVPLEELRKDPLFAAIPPKFLLWQRELVLRRHLKAGEILCRQGEPGHSAFIIKRGRLKVIPQGADPVLRSAEDLIVGEMACLSGAPRNADISAFEDAELWELRRNVLDRMMRSPSARGLFERLYRERALATAISRSEFFVNVSPVERSSVAEFLRSRLEFVRVKPRQTIFRQGDISDCLYVLRLGHVRIGIERYGQEATVLYRGPGAVIGELGLLALSPLDADKSPEDVDSHMTRLWAEGATLPAGERTATCTALDHVELVRIDRDTFLETIRQFSGFRMGLIRMGLNRLVRNININQDSRYMREFIEQGLYQGQSLLVLDLNRCTRCDECTRACIQQHGTTSHGEPVTRLLRDGLRFSDFLVATSCRSCKDAYCMIGCPVDAIHRGSHQQIVIEDHCIGCGLCARNCPYGNIFMAANLHNPIARLKAATCDLCDADGRDQPKPRCVYACPHDAAHRVTGEQLLQMVTSSR